MDIERNMNEMGIPTEKNNQKKEKKRENEFLFKHQFLTQL